MQIIELLFSAFLRENVTGPSIYTEYVEETKAPLIKSGPLPVRETDPISNKNEVLQDKLLRHLERDSEQVYMKMQFLVFFYALDFLLKNVPETIASPDLDLWRARFHYLHD